VYLLYASANRDEDLFVDPDSIRLDRGMANHLALGFGPHACLGASPASLEGRLFFKRFFEKFSNIELADVPERLVSHLATGCSDITAICVLVTMAGVTPRA
jgi:cytochrome P450